MKTVSYIGYILFLLVIVTGCSKIDKELHIESIANHKEIKEDLEYGHISMEFELLDGEDIRSFRAKKNKVYDFYLEYLITEGTLGLEFRDSKNNKIEEVTLTEGEYKKKLNLIEKDNQEGGNIQIYHITRVIRVRSIDEQIKVALVGDKAKGKVKITW